MQVEGSVAFVSGANRGVGACFVQTLLAQGARKVYAGARDVALLPRNDKRVVPVTLDVTRAADVARAANLAGDVNLLINNAGINRIVPPFRAGHLEAAHAEMAVNYFGTLNMTLAFAPALKRNGGALVNVLSILARATLPAMTSLSASKAAALRMTEGMRAELRAHGVRVLAVMPGAIDTDMSRDVGDMPKLAPSEVVLATLAALVDGTEDVYVGDMAKAIASGLATDRSAVLRQLAGSG
ncbi:SDR family NAD(P)-dependent oxidoreductase [Pandoraea nosoerga]|uniref:Short-chain dehydrogenase n=1 Tax=Pandoraea nosoerga TaxID=2508296 RepID=A0A5E4UVZ9_9BURK|nr:SDR family NAD(P)-dependent oxidoreductase [Pandoraea nosoerga]MBN4666521.1 SDR family NAD(P)-dependent oxidoreductase [Pandoraea nosoerga]MBN4674237.1 SDR family NAD(P)-dependent oxidoreductase [Pandoraea nosoerga]MBN4683192.1 SDR family NAD(P)-dependent oxidoreductase [Pandoraea nosoerga]MBN4746819.1 SDR family NAD(P)-dependent oxidoreductase [Pandoraea nosoerga]VVE04127.1 short-chain dehydrogenase [Pandoraea nosoerga]